MRAGLLTEKIVFYRLEKVKTETGSEENTYENGDIFYSHRVNFEIRQVYDFDELFRIEWDGRMYRILSIEKDRHNMSVFIVTELIND